ncbi:ABC transporter substrate-binding protein [Spirillospora sp. CA-108201]
MRTPQRSRATALGFVLGLAALTLSACGSSAATGESVEGKNVAGGAPVKIGYINQEQAATGSFPELRQATEAAFQYVSKDLGGAGGHPVELIKCTVDGSPESAQKCANEMVQKKAVVVISGINFSGPSSYEVVTAAGIPYVTAAPIQGTDFNGKNTFALLGSSPAQFTGEAKFLLDKGVKKVSLIVNDTPSGQAGADVLIKRLKEGGVTDVTEVKESPTATDFTGAVSQAAKNAPDAIAVLFVAPACGQIVQNAKSLGVKATMVLTTGCSSPAVLNAMGSAAEGVHFVQELLPATAHKEDPQVKAYIGAMERFGGIKEKDLTALHANGFAVAMEVADVVGRSGDTPTTASVTKTLKDPAGGKGFMDSPWVCDGSALKDYPSVCNASTRVTTVKDGQMVEVTSNWLGS